VFSADLAAQLESAVKPLDVNLTELAEIGSSRMPFTLGVYY
jgi:hypothetical protein